ncbi:MAG: condensation domain-containing protein, partial [Chloroflexi bacterium]|nr:condensation domain-containing protein [Chloroflexota bacterium]MCI0578243.1 condensation domain-containing protein [Chloroflexota bacterium]MCI0649681.1 condensation domain-containing protein [Chloroflexota bacterium]MCI0728841.1 condensation domain-containing protein [Chloroflexota bacterium]
MSNELPQLDRLTPEEKRRLLAQALSRRAQAPPAASPLSYGQQALWFLYNLEPESWAYNTLFAARICSPVNRPALHQAVQALFDRHESLRTVFGLYEGRPAQRIETDRQVDFQLFNVAGREWEELNQALIAEARRPFDLENGPVARVRLFTLAPDNHVLLLAAHHAVIDLWSYAVLVDELGQLYEQAAAGLPLSLPPVARRYQEFAYWQRALIDGPRGDALWRYWSEQLAGELPVLDLPIARQRPAIKSYNGASHVMTLDEGLAGHLRELSIREKTTLYTALLAAFQALLYRYTGQQDMVIGSPMAGRHLAGFEKVVGYFVNMVPLRTRLDGRLSFRELLRLVRRTVLSGLEHQEFPLSLLVDRLGLARDPGRSPLFDVVFALETPEFDRAEIIPFLLGQAGSRLQWGDLVLEPVMLPQQEAQFDLALHLFVTGNSLSAAWQYNTDLFEGAGIGRLARHYEVLLAGAAANPDQPIARLPLLSQAEC